MEGAAVCVRLFNGATHHYDGVETVDELRKLVAKDLDVRERQVLLMDGLLVLRADVYLRQLDLGPELTAVVRSRWQPAYEAIISRWMLDGSRDYRFYTSDLRQWFVVQVLAIYREVAAQAAKLEPFCTRTSCPCMRAGKRVSYRWAEPGDTVPPRELSAPDYTAALLQLAHRTIGGPGFTLEEGLPLSEEWLDSVKMLLKRFVRVYAHAYLHHFQELADAGLDTILNYRFQHLYFFVRQFDLVGTADMAMLKPIVAYFEEVRRADQFPDLDLDGDAREPGAIERAGEVGLLVAA